MMHNQSMHGRIFMLFLYRFTTSGFLGMLAWLLIQSACPGQEVDFAKRRLAIMERFEKSKGQVKNKAVHDPPLVKAEGSDLADEEPVIGIFLNREARAYPLTMFFGGGGVFELLNDTCGGQPIAVSW